MFTYTNQFLYPWVEGLRHDGDVNLFEEEHKTEAKFYIVCSENDCEGMPDLSWDDAREDFKDYFGEYPEHDSFECCSDYKEYDFDAEYSDITNSEWYDIIASVAKSQTDFASLVQSGKSERQEEETLGPMISTPCDMDFSPDYWPTMSDPSCEDTLGPSDESNCDGPVYGDSDDRDAEFEYFLIINGVKVHIYRSSERNYWEDGYYEGAGYGFIRCWDESGWILINTSLGKRTYGMDGVFGVPYDPETVIYQLWNKTEIQTATQDPLYDLEDEVGLLDSVEFDSITPSEEFFAGLDRWEEGYQANWHNVTDSNNETILAPDGQPIICSGHFRCFKITEETKPKTTKFPTETIIEV